MPYSFYDATVAMAQAALTSLNSILAEAEKHPQRANFLSARLIDDMQPLNFQVHYAAYQAQAMAARLSGHQFPEPEYKDVDSYEKMHALIDEALRALGELKRDTVNNLADTMTPSVAGAKDAEVPMKAIVGCLIMPNVYFHVSMAYAVLRKEGVPLRKGHWSRAFVADYV